MTRHEEMEEKAKEYHFKHPEVWTMMKQFSFQMIERGYTRYAVGAVMERIRWETDIGGDGITQFKISNNHHAFYARWFMNKFPEHDGFFRLCVQKSHENPATGKPEITPENIFEDLSQEKL